MYSKVLLLALAASPLVQAHGKVAVVVSQSNYTAHISHTGLCQPRLGTFTYKLNLDW
jgi:hypothetical protein